jgi:hypothetical protein
MDAFKLALRRPGFALVLAWFAVVPSMVCRGGDGTTLCRWSRTWNGPNSIWRPLTPYYVPRPADPCLNGGYGRSSYDHISYGDGCGFAVEGGYYDENPGQYARGELSGYEESPVIPVGLERLGEIPNDLGISGGAAGSAPARPAR